MTLGAIANLKITRNELMDIPLLHRIPNLMMVERWAYEMEIEENRSIQ